MMISPTVADLIRDTTDRLRRAGIASARLDALVILENSLEHDRAWLLAHPEYDDFDPESLSRTQRLVQQRANRVPLPYLFSTIEFYGLELEVNPQVLIPRIETEALVDYVIDHTPAGTKVIDVGTGSGAIAIALSQKRPDLKLTASDISGPALAIARANAAKYSARDIHFCQSDIMSEINDRFDVIAANLPYLPDNRSRLSPELNHEPKLALFAGKDGLDHYRRLLSEARDHLKSSGYLVIEAEPGQADGLKLLAGQTGWDLIRPVDWVYVLRANSHLSVS